MYSRLYRQCWPEVERGGVRPDISRRPKRDEQFGKCREDIFMPELAGNRRHISPTGAPCASTISASRSMPTMTCENQIAVMMLLVSVKAANPSRPPSRPQPDCLKPPKGMDAPTTIPLLTVIVPALIFFASR